MVAFLDDDCEPEPSWAQQLLSGYREGVIGVGGLVLPATSSRFMLGYPQAQQPDEPSGAEPGRERTAALPAEALSPAAMGRSKKTSLPARSTAFAGANMSFSRQALAVAGQFDERFRFGGEDLDMCMRLARSFPDGRLEFRPQALVIHHFEPSVRDTLRRSRAYGRGSARLYRKWPSMPPTIFPGPLLVLTMLHLSRRHTWLTGAAIAAPQLLYPSGLRHAWSTRSGASLLDAYVQLGQEACGNVGFLEGLWLFRHLVPEPGASQRSTEPSTRWAAGRSGSPDLIVTLKPLEGPRRKTRRTPRHAARPVRMEPRPYARELWRPLPCSCRFARWLGGAGWSSLPVLLTVARGRCSCERCAFPTGPCPLSRSMCPVHRSWCCSPPAWRWT